MVKKVSLLALVFIASFYSVSALGVEQYKGVDNMLLEAGRFGAVPFEHKKHHVAVKDCASCHDLFPKARGSISRLKSGGRLHRRQVMDQCTSCHFDRAQKGKKTGPTSCGGCHKG